MKISKFQIAVLIGILTVILVAWIDLQGLNLIGEKYTNGEFPNIVWQHHLLTAIIIFLIPSLCYCLFRKDKSEAIAIFLSGFIMFYFGLADIFYFWLQGKMIPVELPWLMGQPIISRISLFLGEIVTNISLIVSTIMGGIIVYFTTKYLKEKL